VRGSGETRWSGDCGDCVYAVESGTFHALVSRRRRRSPPRAAAAHGTLRQMSAGRPDGFRFWANVKHSAALSSRAELQTCKTTFTMPNRPLSNADSQLSWTGVGATRRLDLDFLSPNGVRWLADGSGVGVCADAVGAGSNAAGADS
jgi:hypothetical protein